MKRLILVTLLFAAPLFAQHRSVKSVRATVPHSITVTFTASTYVGISPAGIGYNLYRGTVAGGESTTPLNSTPYQCATNCAFVNTIGLVEGMTYFYTVKTVDLANNQMSPASAEVSATIPVTPIPVVTPTPPTNPSAVAK